MARIGSKKTFDRLLFLEAGFMNERGKTPAAQSLEDARKKIAAYVRDVGKQGDLEAILAIERSFLENDLMRHANSGAMAGSLKAALDELAAADRLAEKVQSPRTYKETDAAHSLPKNRIGDIPRDEARQFFRSHAARLLNQDKSRLDEDEKKIIDARKGNMYAAEKVYAARQRQALGLAAPAKEKGRGLSR